MAKPILLPEEKLSDGKRVREIIQRITGLFSESDLEHISIDNKVFLAFQHDKYPIFRRFNITKKSIEVEGYWWLTETQILRYAWNGYASAKMQEKDGVNRIWLKRSFQKGWWYVRDNGNEWYDIEAISATCVNKKTVWEWITCTIPEVEYKRLDKLLGPAEDCCVKHT